MRRSLFNPGAVPMWLSPEGDGGAGGGGEGDKGGDQAPKTVPLTEHKKALDDMHVAKTQVKELSDKLNTMQTELASIKTKKSEENGDFKALYEQTRSEKEALSKTHTDFKASVYNNERIRALETELKKRGLKEGAETVLDFADLEKLPYELTSRGRILVHGVEEQAAELEKKYDYAFSKQKAPPVNSGGGAAGDAVEDSQLTAAYMTELEVKDNKKYREILPRYLAAYKKRTSQGG